MLSTKRVIYLNPGSIIDDKIITKQGDVLVLFDSIVDIKAKENKYSM